MRQLVVLSGKGGTGKTTVAASLARLARKTAVADCDVDAPNLHLVFKPTLVSSKPFYGYQIAELDQHSCIDCGRCRELCRFGAISDRVVDLLKCEGCGVCEAFCPAKDHLGRPAIRLVDNVTGEVSLGKVRGELFSTASLKMGSGASGKLVTEVKKNITSRSTGQELFLIDGSPGIGCPVIASITGAHVVLSVAEPTQSGLHDLERIVQTAKGFGARCLVCINKYDLNPQITEQIIDYCRREGVEPIGKIPFDPQVSKAVNCGKPIVDFPQSPAAGAIIELWNKIKDILEEES